jgi:thiol-disulfide isomerase/thioredoxin
MDRERLSFEAFRGEVVVLNAWATWCPPCVDEMDSFAALRDSVADTGVRFLFLTTEDREHVRRFLRLQGLDLPVAFERTRLPAAYGQFGLPTTWIIDREGRIVLRHPGAARWDTPEVEALLRHLAGDGGPG